MRYCLFFGCVCFSLFRCTSDLVLRCGIVHLEFSFGPFSVIICLLAAAEALRGAGFRLLDYFLSLLGFLRGNRVSYRAVWIRCCFVLGYLICCCYFFMSFLSLVYVFW